MQWFIDNRNDVAERNIASMSRKGKDDRILLSLVSKERLVKILKRMLDETEFLADHGIRSLSKYHKDHPYSMEVSRMIVHRPKSTAKQLLGQGSGVQGQLCAR